MRKSPLLSVVMSVYNSEKYVVEAIDSVLSQTFKNFEFIIINDGSTDNSFELLQEKAAVDSRVILIDRKNSGLTKSLNIALKRAKGKYIARIDADDICLPKRFQVQLDFLENNSNYGLVGSKYKIIDDASLVVCSQRVPFFATDDQIKGNIYRLNPFFHSSMMIEKKLFDYFGCYDERFIYSQDYECWLRFCHYTKMANIDDFLVYRRESPEMLSIKKNKKQLYFAFQARLKHFHLLPVSNIFWLVRSVLALVKKGKVEKLY